MNPMAECPNCSCCPEETNPFGPLPRSDYADRFGPTTRDCIRLADTALRIKIEDDWSGGPGRSGNEMVFGGGKVIRESMGQSVVPRDPGKGKTDTSAGSTAALPLTPSSPALSSWTTGASSRPMSPSATATSSRSARRTTPRR